MAKIKTRYVCQQCGKVAAKALGRCPQCGSWGSMLEELEQSRRTRAGGSALRGTSEAKRMIEIEGNVEERLSLQLGEFARVLGGGIVPGSLVLIGGDPGIGKSTLLLQVALLMAASGVVLYVTGEESARQVKSRAMRLNTAGQLPPDLYIFPETDLTRIEQTIHKLHPKLVIIDSIQTMRSPEVTSGAGSIVQVRESTVRLQEIAKTLEIPIFLVGHVTKEGAIAGPRVLEHIVDTVLYLEGDNYHVFRLLRSVKNRFGPTSEVGVFEMGSAGMIEVSNPSEMFLSERVVGTPGSAIAVTIEGTRPLLVEVQGLTSTTSFGNPRRTANGVDFNRLLLTIAVLTRRVGLKLTNQDVFVNIVGGLRVGEPAVDLAVAIAIASSYQDLPLAADTAFIGEVGLSGELRAVAQLGTRLSEAEKLGFRKVYVPRSPRAQIEFPDGLEVISSRTLLEVLKHALKDSDRDD